MYNYIIISVVAMHSGRIPEGKVLLERRVCALSFVPLRATGARTNARCCAKTMAMGISKPGEIRGRKAMGTKAKEDAMSARPPEFLEIH